MNNPAIASSNLSHMDSLAFAYQAPAASARLRCNAEDFRVHEKLAWEPSGKGGHAYLYVQKRYLTTEAITKKIAGVANTSSRHIGYAGLKDRNAVTSQWFSVDLCGKPEPDWRLLESDAVTVLKTSHHERKLKRGAVEANLFQLTLRNVQGDRAQLEERLSRVRRRGVPNYFGEQRFGIDENNLSAAYQMLTGGRKVNNRHLRGLYYSAARSYLFNLVLSYRVSRDCWDQAVAGDAMILDGSHSYFVADAIDEAIVQRLQSGDIHPSGPLWGKGELASSGEASAMEAHALQAYGEWQHGLEKQGLASQRRALRLLVKDFQWQFSDDNGLQLNFALPSGAYATSVVRELVTHQ